MSHSVVDQGRRRFLIASTSVVGAVGVAAMAAPFLSSWNPSARAKAAGAPVEVNVSKIEEGQQLTVIWRGKPIWLVKRTDAMVDALPSLDNMLRDPSSDQDDKAWLPEYARDFYRSREMGLLVLVGVCTHLGCSPTYRPEMAPPDLGDAWKGGWYCPCHGSRFDLAGRVYKNVPAPQNLQVPAYSYKDEQTVIIGVDENGEAV